MREIASRGQLRIAFLRWAVVTIPFILLLGFASARLAPSGSENQWFLQLIKPGAMPSAGMAPIAWSVVYVLVGMALAMIINARGSRMRGPALVIFALQFALFLVWQPAFFGMHQVEPAMAILGMVFVLALIATVLFARIRPGAALLMLPYLAAVGYAAFLIFQINQLNPNAASLVPSRSTDQILIK